MANNILVTGANGQLGNEIRAIAKSSADSYIFTDIAEDAETRYLDITDLDAVRKVVKENSVNIIINCAAYTNVDKAEEESEEEEAEEEPAPDYPEGDPFAKPDEDIAVTRRINLSDLKFGRNYSKDK